ncbi:hypothetical protein A2U01_0044288 [Trifolium medium]|uniref:Uncharacterized protein n=1 Tax=Trifolium medium TaxID=97028 RepID=A0A392QH95_9FABA|nr:hypothetical protein [Trifolium medium]
MMDVMHKALPSLREYQLHAFPHKVAPSNSKPSQSSHNTNWSPPSNDYIKFDVDVHTLDDGRSGLGFIWGMELTLELRRRWFGVLMMC